MPIRILRTLDWIPKALQQYATRNPIPAGYWELITPTIHSFGTSRVGEMQMTELSLLSSTGGPLEVAHSAVPDDSWRFYLSIEGWHDNPVQQIIAPARIITQSSGFRVARFANEVAPGIDIRVAWRNIAIGPRDRIALEIRNAPAGTTLFARPVWIEMPLGESFESIQ